MPQGALDKGAAARAGIPERTKYARKPEPKKCIGAMFVAPKSASGAAAVNMAYLASRPKMTRDIEMMAAGKIIAGGSIIHTGELKRAAAAQNDMLDKQKNKYIDPLSKKHVRGLRGQVDMEEMTELVPALKKHLETRTKRLAKAKGKEALEDDPIAAMLRADKKGSGGGAGDSDDEDEANEDTIAGLGDRDADGAPPAKRAKLAARDISDAAAKFVRDAMRSSGAGEDDDEEDEAAAKAAAAAAAKKAAASKKHLVGLKGAAGSKATDGLAPLFEGGDAVPF